MIRSICGKRCHKKNDASLSRSECGSCAGKYITKNQMKAVGGEFYLTNFI